MPDSAYVKYSKSLAFRSVNGARDAAVLIRFGRDLYLESLGRDDAFFRDFGPYGAAFPKWIDACAAAHPDFAKLLHEDGRPIGLVALGLDDRGAGMGRVHHFYIEPGHRGQGFGGLLDDYARDVLSAAGAQRARLNVAAQNDRAIRFYEAQGWERCDKRGGLIFMETKL
ncbi:MAG: GNAT family N-acetyltransferase [Pseudomonadota bacterium]